MGRPPFKTQDEELDEIWRRIDSISASQPRTIQAKVFDTETEVRHNMGKKPTSVLAIPRADARVWQTRNASETTIFLAADTPVECDIRVE